MPPGELNRLDDHELLLLLYERWERTQEDFKDFRAEMRTTTQTLGAQLAVLGAARSAWASAWSAAKTLVPWTIAALAALGAAHQAHWLGL